jgi:hypothetical protein
MKRRWNGRKASASPPNPQAIHNINLRRQLGPTITLHNKILNFQTGPLVDYFSNIPSPTYVWMFGGTSPQGSITLQGGIPSLKMSDGTTLLSGSFRTANVTEPAPVSEDSCFYLAGSSFEDNKNHALLTYFGLHRQTANGNFDI